jgi:hypothetical protein
VCVGCTTRRCSVGDGHAALWHRSWGYTAGWWLSAREALYTVALRGSGCCPAQVKLYVHRNTTVHLTSSRRKLTAPFFVWVGCSYRKTAPCSM